MRLVGESIYLDYAAATPLDERVYSAMEPYMSEIFVNPSAQYIAARQAREAYEQARRDLALVIGGKPHEVVLTAGATESINLAIQGVMRHYGGKVVTSNIEHLAVIATARHYDNDLVAASPKGMVDPADVTAKLTPDTTLVSIGYVNNELGTVQALRDIASVIANERQRRLRAGESRPLWFHTDASQAAGLLDVSCSRLGVDMMTLNAGKCYGPKQVGLLWLRAGIMLEPLLYGGSQESGLRAGTENLAGAVGFAKALTLASEERKTESRRLIELRDRLQARLAARLPELVVNGDPKRRVPHILHISIPGLDGERAVFALDQVGVMVATGSACAANKGTRSHVLEAVGMSDECIDGSLRISLGRQTTAKDIDRAADYMIVVISRERQGI